MGNTYNLSSGIGSVEVYKDEIKNVWVARLFTELDNGRTIYLDTISARTKEEVLGDAGVKIKECRIGMKHHGQIASVN